MILGIDCSRYRCLQPTGVEVYTDHIVEGIVAKSSELAMKEIRLYVRTKVQEEKLKALFAGKSQSNITIRLLEHQKFWTLFWFTIELSTHPIDALFVPSHTLPLMTPKRVLFTPHGIESAHVPGAYSWLMRCYLAFSLRFAKWCDAHFIAVSKSVKKDLQEKFAVDERRISVIYHGYDRQNPNNPKDLNGPKAPPDLFEGDYILNIGRLELRKNQLRLIEAFEMTAAEFPKVSLVLVGRDGFGADKIRARAQSSVVKDRIHVAGYLDREITARLFEKALIFAFPSLAEGFGIPILEAFDAGIPVLTSKGTATEEVAGDGALLCDPTSSDSIAQGLRFYLTDEKIRQEKIRLGRKRLEQFCWQKCSDETLAVLKEITAVSGPR